MTETRKAEKHFNIEVTQFVTRTLSQWQEQTIASHADAHHLDIEGLFVASNIKIQSGRIVAWQQNRDWTMKTFKREVDVAICRKANIDGRPGALPIIAIELKTGESHLNTDLIDTKNTIYNSLKDQYPCLLNCLIIKNNLRRNMSEETLFRNGRHFDRIIPDWDQKGQAILSQSILCHLDYAIKYWAR